MATNHPSSPQNNNLDPNQQPAQIFQPANTNVAPGNGMYNNQNINNVNYGQPYPTDENLIIPPGNLYTPPNTVEQITKNDPFYNNNQNSPPPKNRNTSKNKARPSNFRLLNASSPFYFQEAYNSLRTNLKSMFISNMYQKIIVTSSIPNEGKSNITLNLGISLATDGSKVLIIDCDLRKPSINQYLKIPKGVSRGLVSMLQNPSNVFEDVIYFEDLGIDVLTAGSTPPNPSELLGSENMRSIIEQVEPYYDYILFDTPPVGVVTDAAVLSQFTDGSLLVIKQNSATYNQAKRAKSRLQAVGSTIIGCILNDYNLKTVQDDTYAYYYVNTDNKNSNLK